MFSPSIQALLAVTAALLLALSAARADTSRRIVIEDHLDHTWRNELVSYPVEFDAGECSLAGLGLLDEEKQAVPVQLTDVSAHADGTLASATLWFLVRELPAGGRREWTLRAETAETKQQYETDLSVRRQGDTWQIETQQVGARILAGERHYQEPREASETPAPLQQLRLRSGQWIGRGRWQSERKCTGYTSRMVARGPVFAELQVTLRFEDARSYDATYRVIAGQEVVLVEEEFDLGDPDRFVLPDYGPRERLLWDWWGGTHGRADSPNNFLFSLYEDGAFTPTAARWRGHHSTDERLGSPRKGSRTVNYALDFSKDRLDININSYLQWGHDEAIFYTAWNRQDPRDAVAVIGIRPSRWIHPDIHPHKPPHINQFVQTNNIQVRTGEDPDLYLRAPVNRGRRAYALAALDAREEIPEDPGTFGRTGELLVKYGHKPLNKIKDWVLQWDEPAPHPRLFCEPGDIEALRKRVESQAEAFRRRYSYLYRYLTEEDQEAARQVLKSELSRLRSMRDGTLEGYGPHTNYLGHMVWGIRMHQIGARIDVALSSEGIEEAERQEARALLSYVQHCAWDKDHFPGRNQGFAWGSANMATNIMTGRAMWADLLAGHPKSEEWARRGVMFPVYDLNRYLHPVSGVAQECPGYTGVNMTRDLVALSAMNNLIGREALSELIPRLKGLAHWRLTTMPPPDVRFGQRMLLTLGDTPYHGDNVLGLLGTALLPYDRELAQQCLWGYRQSGSKNRPMFRFAIDNSVPASRPDLRSRRFEGFGSVLRTGTGEENETFLAHYHGDFSWGHYHTDQGELIFHSKGAPLMADFGSQYQPNITQAAFHNTITFNHSEPDEPRECPGRGEPGCFYTGRPWFPHEHEPYSCLQYALGAGETEQPALGRITAFATLEGADYSRSEQRMQFFERVPYRYDRPRCWKGGTEFEVREVPPFTWTRQVVLVRDEDPMGANYFVVHDDLGGNQELEPAFNLWSLTKAVEQNGERLRDRATVREPLHLPGQWGVDLEVFVARPQPARIRLAELGYRGRRYDRYFKPLHGRKFEERQKLVRVLQKPGGGFTVAVYPRKPDEPRPQFGGLDGIPGVRVELPQATHWVFLSPANRTFEEGPVRFRGTAGVVKKHDYGRVELHLLAAGEISCGNVRLKKAAPGRKVGRVGENY
jgi:hypothetical protein